MKNREINNRIKGIFNDEHKADEKDYNHYDNQVQ